MRALDILFEDVDLLVVNKPAGLLTSTVPREPRPTLAAMVREHVLSRQPRARVGVIHRLDREASGVLVFSKEPAAYESLKSQLFHRTMKRVYNAIVAGEVKPPVGRFKSRLVELPSGEVRSTRREGSGELAITDYVTIGRHGETTLLRLSLLTGRKHQIRVHLSENGWPILGDAAYGKDHPANRLMLHATELSFKHPRTDKVMKVVSELPEEMRKVLRGGGTAKSR